MAQTCHIKIMASNAIIVANTQVIGHDNDRYRHTPSASARRASTIAEKVTYVLEVSQALFRHGMA